MVYDVILVGSGPANLFAAMELARDPNLKILILEKARRLNDSRNVSLGWLGGSARSAVSLFLQPGFGGEVQDIRIFELFGERLKEYTNTTLKISKPKLLKRTVRNLSEAGISIAEPPTIQMTEDRTIKLGDFLYSSLKRSATILHKIEVSGIYKEGTRFNVETNDGVYTGKRIILGLGRGGTRSIGEIDSNLDFEYEQDSFELGVRLEFPFQSMEECLSKSSHFTMKFGCFKTTAPVVQGTVETEEVGDIKISNGRIINSHRGAHTNIGFLKKFPSDRAQQELYRLIEIVNVLCDGQLLREPISRILSSKSVVSPVPEYDSLKEGLQKLVNIFPDLATRCAVYAPEARLNTNRFKLSPFWETGIDGCYIVGDMSGRTKSFVQAACSGLIAAKHILDKEGAYGESRTIIE